MDREFGGRAVLREPKVLFAFKWIIHLTQLTTTYRFQGWRTIREQSKSSRLADRQQLVPVLRLSPSDDGDGRRRFSGYAQAVHHVVPCDVVRQYPRKTEPVPWGCSGSWGWAAIGQPGLGCTNCEGRWSGLGEISCQGG